VFSVVFVHSYKIFLILCYAIIHVISLINKSIFNLDSGRAVYHQYFCIDIKVYLLLILSYCSPYFHMKEGTGSSQGGRRTAQGKADCTGEPHLLISCVFSTLSFSITKSINAYIPTYIHACIICLRSSKKIILGV
jgi:hypothetical protein